MVIKVVERRVVESSNVNHTDRWVAKIFVRWLTPLNRGTVQVSEQATSQKVIFVGAARVRDDEIDSHDGKALSVYEVATNHCGVFAALRFAGEHK